MIGQKTFTSLSESTIYYKILSEMRVIDSKHGLFICTHTQKVPYLKNIYIFLKDFVLEFSCNCFNPALFLEFCFVCILNYNWNIQKVYYVINDLVSIMMRPVVFSLYL